MAQRSNESGDFVVAYYAGNRQTGSLALIHLQGGEPRIEPIPTLPESGLPPELRPVLVGLDAAARKVILLDPKSREIRAQDGFPADAFPAHIYEDPESSRRWFMNDGDKETGNDRLNCGEGGSSVTVVDKVDSVQARFLKTICVGRGHHQAAYSRPTPSAPDVPRRAWISSLKDGSISVIGNDPAADDYLKVVATIDLCEPEREEGGRTGIPNNAFPHGLVFSPLTGRMYNLNNGYGDIAVIDPRSCQIEARVPFKGHSNLFMVPGGRYIIGRGADRKSDPAHVIAHLTVLDVETMTVVDRLTLPDIYVSKYYFDPDGTRLFLTTGTSGSPEQQANLKPDALLVIDLTTLPRLVLRRELRLGTSSGSLAIAKTASGLRLFSSNGEAGSIVIIDGERDEVLQTIAVGERMSHSRVWLPG
jgi:DNA-binding beta-propeller fold protein YncE